MITAGRVDFDELRARLDIGAVAEGEGLKVWRRGRRLAFLCPSCGKGDRHGSGACSRDGARWFCVRCEAGGDVVDLMRIARGLDVPAAIKLACELAGLDSATSQARPGEVWRTVRASPPPATEPEELEADDLAERMRAVRLGALHYQRLAAIDGSEDVPSASEHIDFLASLGTFDPGRVSYGDDCRRRVLDIDTARHSCAEYLQVRMGAAWDDARQVLAELVGFCPSRDSGLRGYLRIMGGDALVEAGQRAGLFRPNGAERFAGMLIYVWTDAAGRAVYLTGRVVPALADACAVLRSDKGEVVKSMALPVFNPDKRDDRIGIPAPAAPFGAHLAVNQEGAIVIVEGELDAVHELVVGPAVATGGTGRMGSARGVDALRRFLAGRDAIVAFDAEADSERQKKTDERGHALARAIGARWVQGGTA